MNPLLFSLATRLCGRQRIILRVSWRQSEMNVKQIIGYRKEDASPTRFILKIKQCVSHLWFVKIVSTVESITGNFVT